MKKVGVVFISLFLVFSIMAHVTLIAADEDSNTSSDSTRDLTEDDNTGADDGDSEDNESSTEDDETDDSEDDSKTNLIRERTKTESKEVIIDDNGCKIKIEREIRMKDGARVEVVKKKMECPDGRKSEVQFKRENRTVNGEVREKIRYEVEGKDAIEVELEDEMEVEEEINGTEYKLKARLRNGEFTQIKVMPDRASEIAIARLKALNFTIELREVGNGNETRVAYFAGTEKNGRFLGVFKTKVNVETEIDSETGEVVVGKPWWAFLVSGEDSDQTTETEVEIEMPVPGTNTTDTEVVGDTGLTLDEDEDGILDVNESDIAA